MELLEILGEEHKLHSAYMYTYTQIHSNAFFCVWCEVLGNILCAVYLGKVDKPWIILVASVLENITKNE
jgi:hypothetical protein